ncbi:Ribonuclease H protein [Quillaja saponaria]|uniref:Ribonuclease H protein n=1 Tax=Quillaja saponaria TaxID=32244 RepID=A0AAD7M4I7_QUISA|nr:Ribonuclease H protein [Quillaja saponaria]
MKVIDRNLGLVFSGWVKLNCDGTSKGNGSISSCRPCGSLIRGDSGEWLGGLAVNLGPGCNNFAELFRIYHGLCLTWDLGFKSVTDSVVAVDLLSVVVPLLHPLHHLIQACR